MTFLILAVLLQTQIVLPQRAALDNPSAAGTLPLADQKDFDKLWKRFLSGKEDAKTSRDLDKLAKKRGETAAFLLLAAYTDLYSGRQAEAEQRLQSVLKGDPSNNTALFYMAEIAYSRGEFVKATEYFQRLRAERPPDSRIEMKSQRALLLALDSLVQEARRAISEDKLSDAERLYRQALAFAPQEAALHGALAEILSSLGRTAEAEAETRRQAELSGSSPPSALNVVAEEPGKTAATAPPPDDDMLRWGNQIQYFREIRQTPSITREQVAGLLVQYFPQLKSRNDAPQIMTDIDGSWATSAIQVVVTAGILDSMPNHTFQPARTVSRGEFAQAIGRLTRLLGVSPSEAPPITPSDVVPESTLQRELQPVLGYELLTLDNAGNFGIAAPVRGEEAVIAAEKLLHLFHRSAP